MGSAEPPTFNTNGGSGVLGAGPRQGAGAEREYIQW
jgi:hypothetical protein